MLGKEGIGYSVYTLIFIYLIIVLLQQLYFRGYLTNYLSMIFKKPEEEIRERDNIYYNNHNQSKLDKLFGEIINERIKMLDDMSYPEWLAYNIKNATIKHNNIDYYLTIYEKTEDEKNPDYILRASSNLQALNIPYSDLLQQEKYAFIFTSFAPNPDLISTMDDLTKQNNINDISFYTLDYSINRAVKKHSIVGNWEKPIDKEKSYKGVITMGYILKDVEKDYSHTYYDYSSPYFFAVISSMTLLGSILLHYSKSGMSSLKPVSFLIVLNIYLTYYYSTVEGITTFETEQSKFADINSGILSLSFLTGINTYILDKLQKLGKHKFSLHSETSFYFLFALLLMLASLYKINNYAKMDNIRTFRVDTQCAYNMCVIINFYVLFNYLIYVGYSENIIKFK